MSQRRYGASRTVGSVARKNPWSTTFPALFAICLTGPIGCSFADETGERSPSNAGSPVDLSRAEQIAVINERIDATNTKDWARWEALHDPDATRTAPELEQPLEGSSAMRAAIETLSVAFPDYRLEFRQAFGEGPWLAVRLHTTGTMTGPLMLSDGTQVPPTGRTIEQDWTALVRFNGERIAEFNEYYDQLTLMTQLGLLE